MTTMNEEQALAEKLRTDAIAIFGDGQAERDIIEWFYAALLAAAPAQPEVQRLREALETLVEHFEYYMGDNECRPLENARAALAASIGQEVV